MKMKFNSPFEILENVARFSYSSIGINNRQRSALVVACALVLAETASTSSSTKPVKEPKEIKEAATASKDVKAAKEAAKKKKDCARECGTAYEPICAHDPNDATSKPRTFGTECALNVHNCEMGTSECLFITS